MLHFVASLIVALSLADAAGPEPPARPVMAIEVPYVPQTESLCGGAAAAMVFRYWGERHADVAPFAPLVDRRAGGIATGVLTEAIRARGWKAAASSSTLEGLHHALQRGHPIILLVEDRPGRYHYVVAVGADDQDIFVHDPVWGPSRRLSASDLLKVWKPANFWSLLVLPPDTVGGASTDTRLSLTSPAPLSGAATDEVDSVAIDRPRTTCDVLLEQAVGHIRSRGLALADDLLGNVRTQCPDAAEPVAELAGVRFAQRRWEEAAELAAEALRRNGMDVYAWDLLGSSRYMADDLAGALDAWNRIRKPKVDAVRIEGLSRTSYAFIAEVLDLRPNTLLTERHYRLADRRLRALPGGSTARIRYSPDTDGFATVDVAMVEPSARPGWIALGTRAIANRELNATLPGWTGHGDIWDLAWRWWDQRPGFGVRFAAPRLGPIPGVWRIDGSWSRQAYASLVPTLPTRETWTHVKLAIGNWVSPNVRYEIAAGFDSWDRLRRAASVGAEIERRFLSDRFSLAASATTWASLSSQAGFHAVDFSASLRSTVEPRRFVHLAQVKFEGVTEHAPLALWSGAGEGHGRPLLLRAHPLVHDGIIAGPIFGRRVASLNLETQSWLDRPSWLRLGIAAFADAATASRRLESSAEEPLHIDVGGGLRVQLPGREGTLRVDYGHGLRDGRHALTFGWQSTERRRVLP